VRKGGGCCGNGMHFRSLLHHNQSNHQNKFDYGFFCDMCVTPAKSWLIAGPRPPMRIAIQQRHNARREKCQFQSESESGVWCDGGKACVKSVCSVIGNRKRCHNVSRSILVA
jgi:hypothetical protein